MKRILLVTCISLLLSGPMAGSAYAQPEEISEAITEGKAIYEQVCVLCHGIKGQGDGPAAFFFSSYSAPRPRVFTQNAFKFRSTPTGQLPTDQDLFRTLTNGVAGYMPSFAGLTAQERWNVIAYIKTFNAAFKATSPQPIELGAPTIPSSLSSIEKGRALYRNKCQTCHGPNGKGDSQLSQQGALKGHFDLPVRPRDLTNRLSFKNGTSPQDVFRSIMTGLDGGAMPGYADTFASQEEDAWHLVNYIFSLSW